MASRAIVLAGLPKAGKSLLSGGLYDLLRERGESFFIEKLSPDSEGQWTYESGKQELARGLKLLLKEKGEFFTPAFVERKISSIKSLAKVFKTLVLDLGGIPSAENASFIKAAKESSDSLVVLLLYREGQNTEEWEEFLSDLGVEYTKVKTSWDFSQDVKKQAKELASKIKEGK